MQVDPTKSTIARLLMATTIAIVAASASAARYIDARASGQAPPPAERRESDAAFFAGVLGDPAAAETLRRAAADRLVRDVTPEARRALDKALRGTGLSRRFVADALDRAAASAPDFAQGLDDALVMAATGAWMDDERDAFEATARVLAAIPKGACDRLAEAATNPALSTQQRLAAIATLGELRTRAAVKSLMDLLNDAKAETPEFIVAICAALDRATGLAFGGDVTAWRRWWGESIEAAKLDDAQVKALAARAAASDRELADERRRAERLEARVVEAYEQLFVRLTQAERLERCSTLVGDELASVRGFAISQLERMLRNGERADEATRRRSLVVLDDPVPELRERGARLLADLGVSDLAMRLAERLPRESDPGVAESYLAVIASHPQPEAFPTLLTLLKDPALCEPACRVIAAMADANRLPREWEALVLPILREVVAARPSAATVQLLAMAGEEADTQKAIALLDSNDAGVRRGAAEGLRRRGIRRPLIARASDAAIFVPLVAALAEEPKTLDTVRTLVSVPPQPDSAPDWNASVARVMSELPPTEIVAADRLLAAVPACEARSRLAGLSRLVTTVGASVAKADVDEGLTRYVDLLVAEGRGEDAIVALEAVAPNDGDPCFAALFRARALTGNFREAARMVPTARRWIDLLADVARDPANARPLADEISNRFGTLLSVEERIAFDKLRRELPAPNAPSTATAPSER